MKDIGKALLAKTDTITESWLQTICKDLDIESAKGLAYKAVRNSIPKVLEAVATLLSDSLKDCPDKLENKGLEHGTVRAEQGYDVTEVIREYGLLRQVVFEVLKPDLLSGSSDEILHTIKLIDSVIDQVISLSIESYIGARLAETEQLTSQLILTNQELTRLVATQKEDLSHLAHELKSPLNSIIGFSNLLLQQQQKQIQGQQSSSLNLQLTQKVIENGRQLLSLINDSLEISRYEAGKMKPDLQSTDVKSLIQRVIEALEVSAIEKNLELSFDGDRAPEQVVTDPLRLRQIVINLVSNGIRYTETGKVKVSCQKTENDQWLLIVADTGVGISLEAQQHIFEPYYRVKGKKGYSPTSTGLGLAIVNKLVKLLQGKIELVSEPGEGSTFTITFPIIVTSTLSTLK